MANHLITAFITMLDATERNGNVLPDHLSLTPFGRYLRSTSLDELPSLWNIFTGELSVVGPCSLLMEYLPLYNSEQSKQHWMKSGLTAWMPAHPTFFARKSVYERFGMFNLNYKITADFELLFTLIEQNNIKTKYLPKVLVKMRLGGQLIKVFQT